MIIKEVLERIPIENQHCDICCGNLYFQSGDCFFERLIINDKPHFAMRLIIKNYCKDCFDECGGNEQDLRNAWKVEGQS